MSVVRILCYNIHGGYDRYRKRDLHRLHALLESYNVDIGVFQEMETRPARGGTAADVDIVAGKRRPYHLPGPTMKQVKGWYGNLIVSRFPITRALVHNLETRKVLEPRNAVDAQIDSPIGVMRIIGTHLSLLANERWSEVGNLLRLMDEVDEETKSPLLLMGDMNEWRGRSRLIKHMDSIMTPLVTGKSFPSRFPVFRLDRVWYDNIPFIIKGEVIKDKATATLSDHLPVLVTLEKE
jgi:endonuclease/exonuclease/phosphatase family metal-dependent hydrolase